MKEFLMRILVNVNVLENYTFSENLGVNCDHCLYKSSKYGNFCNGSPICFLHLRFFSVSMGATSKGMKDSISLINDAGRICEEINEAVNMQINSFSPSVGND